MKKLLLIAVATMTVASGAHSTPRYAEWQTAIQTQYQNTFNRVGTTPSYGRINDSQIQVHTDNITTNTNVNTEIDNAIQLLNQNWSTSLGGYDRAFLVINSLRNHFQRTTHENPTTPLTEVQRGELYSALDRTVIYFRTTWPYTTATENEILRLSALAKETQRLLNTQITSNAVLNDTIASQDDLLLRQTLQITAKDVEIAEKDGKLTSIQDVIDAANVRVPDNITVQGQRASNRGQRGVDVQSWAGTSNARRPWQRDQVSVRTNINGDIDVYTVNIRQQLAPQIDRLARSIAKEYYDKGFDEGYEDGYENGYRDGFRDGYNQALSDVQTAKDG